MYNYSEKEFKKGTRNFWRHLSHQKIHADFKPAEISELISTDLAKIMFSLII